MLASAGRAARLARIAWCQDPVPGGPCEPGARLATATCVPISELCGRGCLAEPTLGRGCAHGRGLGMPDWRGLARARRHIRPRRGTLRWLRSFGHPRRWSPAALVTHGHGATYSHDRSRVGAERSQVTTCPIPWRATGTERAPRARTCDSPSSLSGNTELAGNRPAGSQTAPSPRPQHGVGEHALVEAVASATVTSRAPGLRARRRDAVRNRCRPVARLVPGRAPLPGRGGPRGGRPVRSLIARLANMIGFAVARVLRAWSRDPRAAGVAIRSRAHPHALNCPPRSEILACARRRHNARHLLLPP